MKRFTVIVSILMLVILAGCSSTKPAQPSSAPAPAPAPAAAPAPAPQEPVPITFWPTYNAESAEAKTFNGVVIPGFTAKNPTIKVNSVYFPYDGLHDKLVAAIAGGTGPDVMRMDIIWVPEFAKLGALESLDALAGFDGLKANMESGPLSTNQYKGKYYGLPMDTNTQVIVYNPDFLKEAGLSGPPKTADEFKAFVTKFTGKDGKYGLALGGTYPWQVLPFWWSLGGQITNADYTKSSGFVNSDKSVAALQFLADLNKAGGMASSMIGGQPTSWDGFKGGKYGAVLEGPWFYSAMEKDIKDKMSGAVLPAGTAGSISVVGGEDVVLFKASKQKEAAWKFIQYILSDDAQKAMIPTGQVPVTRSVLGSSAMQQVWYFPLYAQQLQTALPRTPVPTWNQIDKALGDAFEAVFRQKSTPKEALDKAAKEIDALLQ